MVKAFDRLETWQAQSQDVLTPAHGLSKENSRDHLTLADLLFCAELSQIEFLRYDLSRWPWIKQKY